VDAEQGAGNPAPPTPTHRSEVGDPASWHRRISAAHHGHGWGSARRAFTAVILHADQFPQVKMVGDTGIEPVLFMIA
jgi:hypothetical protein